MTFCQKFLLAVASICGFLALGRIVAFIIREKPRLSSPDGRRCQDPPFKVGKWPLGVDLTLRLLKSVKEQRLPMELLDLHEEMGDTFASSFFGMRSIRTRDPRNIKAILATQFEDYGLAQERRAHHSLLGTKGIFTQDGPSWSDSRALIRPSFERTQVADLAHLEVFMQIVLSMINALPAHPSTRLRALELQQLFQSLTMDASTDFLFGNPIGALSPGRKYSSMQSGGMAFEEAFDIAQEGLAMRAPLSNWYWLVNPKSFRQACAVVRSQIGVYVSRSLRKACLQDRSNGGGSGKAPGGGGEGGSKYVFLEALAEKTRDPQVLRDQVLNVMLAGRDTTAALLSWTFLCLAKHPEVFRRLRTEISAVVGVDQDARVPTQAELRSIQYLKWVLQEVLRLYPPVPINARRALHATTLPYGGGPDGNSPISIRKGERIVYSAFALHRRTDIYGPDSMDFRPERWGEEDMRRVGWGWLPFNGGPRICLGQQMALTHASFFVTRMLQVYSVLMPQNPAEANEIMYDTKLVMASGKGVHVLLR